MRHLFVLSLVLVTVAFPAGAEDVLPAVAELPTDGCARILGPGQGQVIEVPSDFPRDEWTYWQNCDGTFENGGCWYSYCFEEQTGYDCGFAEGYHGPVQVHGIRVYVTQDGWWNGETQDLYVWGGGVGGAPGCVLAMQAGVELYNVPFWPDVGANDFEIEATVAGRFYVGHVMNYFDYYGYYDVFDYDSPGDAWTYAPLDCFGPGWIPCNEWLGGDPFSVGIGVYISESAGVDELDEGRILEQGSAQQIFDDPTSERTRAFLSMVL